MVVLDEDPVVEAEAVVRATAAANGVLLERAQPGRRLPGVEDRRAGAFDRVDEAASERGDSGEAAEEVERRALAGEDCTRGACDPRDHGRASSETVALGSERLELDLRIERPEDGRRGEQARRRRPAA